MIDRERERVCVCERERERERESEKEKIGREAHNKIESVPPRFPEQLRLHFGFENNSIQLKREKQTKRGFIPCSINTICL